MPKQEFCLRSAKNKTLLSNSSPGFSLVEILLSLLFIGAIVTILFTTSGSLFTRRGSNLQSVAAKIATAEIERLRGLEHSDVITDGINTLDCTGGSPTSINEIFDPKDTQLGTDFKLTTTISCYDTAEENEIVSVNVLVEWQNESGNIRDLTMDTLISASGL